MFLQSPKYTRTFQVKLYKAYTTTYTTFTGGFIVKQTTKTETTTTDITTISTTVVEGGYIDLSNAYKSGGYILKGFASVPNTTTPAYPITDNKFYPSSYSPAPVGTLYAVWQEAPAYTVSSLAEFNQYAGETSSTGIGFQNPDIKFKQTADISGSITVTTLLSQYDGGGYNINS